MYKLIALDMDGTLLRKDKTISDRTKRAIKSAREKGVTVVLATGRPIEGVTRYLEELDMFTDNDYVLSYNGGLVLKTRSKEVISKIALTGKDLHELYKLSRELNTNIHAFSETKGLITPEITKYTELEANINGININVDDYSEIENDHSIIKIMMIDEKEAIDRVMEQLPKEIYDKYTVVRSAPHFLEFLDKRVNKGVGVEMLADHMGITLEQVITMGDAGNDLHMIECAGMGIAMGNASEEIKKEANYITDTNDEDGVAKAIEKFVL